MGVALREDSTLVGVFSPRKVGFFTTVTNATVCHLFSVMQNADTYVFNRCLKHIYRVTR